MMVYNNSKGNVHCCAVNVPWMAHLEKEFLKDIAIQTGATIIDNEYGIKLEDVKIEHFGSAKNIVIDANTTHIVGGSGDQELIDERIHDIQLQIAAEKSAHLK